MKINQKDLVILSYPFTGSEKRKVRPALIISNNNINKNSSDSILVPLTTIIKKTPYSLVINQENLSSGKLIKESRIIIDKMFSLRQDLILKKIGTLNEKTFENVRKKFFSLI